MIVELRQLTKDLFAAEFALYRGDGKIGTVTLKGKLGHREAELNGIFCHTQFEMRYGKNSFIFAFMRKTKATV